MLRLALALAAAALGAAPAAAAETKARVVLTEEAGQLRHAPTGTAMPEALGELRRVANLPGNPAVVLYRPPGASPDDARNLAIAVGIARSSPGMDHMRQQSRAHAKGDGTLEILSEGPFDWAGGARTQTFHGAYASGGLRKLYWHAWAAGYGITVMAVAPRSQAAQMESVAAAVAAGVFGAPR